MNTKYSIIKSAMCHPPFLSNGACSRTEEDLIHPLRKEQKGPLDISQAWLFAAPFPLLLPISALFQNHSYAGWL